jgi:hypothetical protein
MGVMFLETVGILKSVKESFTSPNEGLKLICFSRKKRTENELETSVCRAKILTMPPPL